MNIYPSLFERLKSQHQALQQLVAGINNEKINTPPAPEKWSALDNIAHLARYQKIFTERIHRMLNEEIPAFEPYNGNLDPEFTPYRTMTLVELFNIIETDRKVFLDLVLNLNHEQLSRIGIHPRYGRLTILKWSEFFALHEAHHLFTVFQLVNAPQ